MLTLAGATACTGPEVNVAPESPSCEGGLDCKGVSCCETILVPGGSFPMGRSVNGTDAAPNIPIGAEGPEHTATVADFELDAFEVTVGRFRNFVDAYTGAPPAPGAGAHPRIAGSGWQKAWNEHMAPSREELIARVRCQPDPENGLKQWTYDDDDEQMAINCVSWYEAFAFCAWDGGWLPTETEWEYAAAGGDENRLFPWGGKDPESNPDLATLLESYPGPDCYTEDCRPMVAVGAHPAGNGRWGHRDLAGSMWEWTLDGWDPAWYSGGGAHCDSCANLDGSAGHSVRGGGWWDVYPLLRAADRGPGPSIRNDTTGFRCARKPKP